MKPQRPTLAVTTLAAAILLAAFSGPSVAHSKLRKSFPAAGATVTGAVAEIRLDFAEAIEPTLSGLDLRDGNGSTLVSGAGASVCQPRTCRLAVDLRQPGGYSVHYKVLSQDGHVIENSFAFSLAAPE